MSWNQPGGNGQDPWNKPNKQSGPPDIDEAFRRLQRKLAGIFGGKSGNGGDTSRKGSAIGFSFIFIIALIVWALSGIFIVNPAQQAVVLRFGKQLKNRWSRSALDPTFY